MTTHVRYRPPPWLGTAIVVALLTLYVALIVMGREVPATLVALVFSAVGAVLGVEIGIFNRGGKDDEK